MKNENFLSSNTFKTMLPVIIIGSAIMIWQKGYAFGQWLYEILH